DSEVPERSSYRKRARAAWMRPARRPGHILGDRSNGLLVHALLIVPLAVDVLAEPVLIVTDVLALALGHLAVRHGLPALHLDLALLVEKPRRLLRGQLSALDALIDPVCLVGLALLDGLGMARRHADREEERNDERNEPMHDVPPFSCRA